MASTTTKDKRFPFRAEWNRKGFCGWQFELLCNHHFRKLVRHLFDIDIRWLCNSHYHDPWWRQQRVPLFRRFCWKPLLPLLQGYKEFVHRLQGVQRRRDRELERPSQEQYHGRSLRPVRRHGLHALEGQQSLRSHHLTPRLVHWREADRASLFFCLQPNTKRRSPDQLRTPLSWCNKMYLLRDGQSSRILCSISLTSSSL